MKANDLLSFKSYVTPTYKLISPGQVSNSSLFYFFKILILIFSIMIYSLI